MEIQLQNDLISLALFYYFLTIILGGLFALLYDIYSQDEVEKPVPRLHLIPTTVYVGGLIYPAIADLDDREGLILRQLYTGVPNVQIVRIYCHVSHEEFWCVRTTTPIGISLLGNYLAWPLNANLFADGDQYITTLFPSFNPAI